MMQWLQSVLSGLTLPGVQSRRLISTVIGTILLAWLCASYAASTLVELPLSILLLVALCVGASIVTKDTP